MFAREGQRCRTDGPAGVPKRSENTHRIAELEAYTAKLERQLPERQQQLNVLNERLRNHAKAKSFFARGLPSGLSRFAAGLKLPR